MTHVERLKQYLGKASFSSESDRYSALTCLEEIDSELADASFKITYWKTRSEAARETTTQMLLQRDDLLVALQQVVRDIPEVIRNERMGYVEAAIAKATGG